MVDHILIICHIEEPYIGTHKSLWSKLTARKFCAIKGVKAVSLKTSLANRNYIHDFLVL